MLVPSLHFRAWFLSIQYLQILHVNLVTAVKRNTVRYPTCLRTEFDSNAISLSAQHPIWKYASTSRTNSSTTPQPVALREIHCLDLSIDCAIIPIHLFNLFMTRSALVSRLWSFISICLWFSDSCYHIAPSTLSIVCGTFSPIACDIYTTKV